MGGTASQPHAQPDPTEWGIMVLLDLVGSTPQSLDGSDQQLRDYQQHRLQHVTQRARRHGFERLDDQGDADLLFRPGDDARPLLELFHDLNHRDPVPDFLHFRPMQRMVAHHQRFAFGPRDAEGRRKQLSSNHLTLQFRFEKACPERALLVTRQLYELLRDHTPHDWVRCVKPIPHKLKEWSRLTADEIHWLGLPGTPLHANVQRSYAQLEEKVAAAEAVERPWHLPKAAEQFFGRGQETCDVADLLRRHRRVALIGPGGMGKTALACEALTILAPARDLPGLFPGGIYSHDYYQSPSHSAALSSILAQAKLETTPDRDRPGVVKRLLDEPGVLLYLEGCEKAEQLFELLNLSPQVKVLVTTREPDKCGGAHPHAVGALDPVSAAGLLAYHAGVRELPADPAKLKPWLDLANHLGRHPLGLLLAGAWLHKRRKTPAEFLDQLTRGGFTFWDTNLEPKENLRVLFRHSAEAAAAKHGHALAAWFALALHAHGPVPLSALCGALGCEADEAEQRLGALQDYSLAEPVELAGATVGQTERAWQLTHALLGEWGRGDLRSSRREEAPTSSPQAAGKAGDSDGASLPHSRRRCEESLTSSPTAEMEKDSDGDSLRRHLRDEGDAIHTAWLDWWKQDLDHCFDQRSVPGGPARYQALQPHWDALLLNLAAAEGDQSTRLSLFLTLTASAHDDMGNYSTAEPLYRRALTVQERVLGPEHPDTLTSINNLAHLLRGKGDLEGAIQLKLREMPLSEKVLGAEHPQTLSCINNLAELLRVRGDLAAAEPLLRHALTVRERVLGPEHPNTLGSINNLALLLQAKGDLAAAEPLHRRVLAASELVLGPEHPNTLSSVNNLASLLRTKGDLAAAEPLYRRALESLERLLGLEHPDTLISVNNLALLLRAKGDLEAAEPLLRRGLEGNERVLGPEHPNTLTSINNLAGLLYTKQDLAGAEPLYRRALTVRERVLGLEHPDTLTSVNNLAFLLQAKGDLAGAEPLLRRGLTVQERVLGPEHPDTLTSVNNLAFLLQDKGDLAGAEPLVRRGLAVRERVLGPEHPDTLTSVNSLAFLLYAKGELAAALPLLERAVQGLRAKLGPEHPDTKLYEKNLAILREQLAEKGKS